MAANEYKSFRQGKEIKAVTIPQQFGWWDVLVLLEQMSGSGLTLFIYFTCACADPKAQQTPAGVPLSLSLLSWGTAVLLSF